MNLYLISQDVNNGYDTYDSAIVAASSEQAAKKIHPSGNGQRTTKKVRQYDSWAGLDDVHCKFIGIAARGTKQGVILASFNAG